MAQAALSGSYLNSNLFSNYYLDERVYGLDAWDCDDEAEAALAELRELYEGEESLLGGYNEDSLLKEWMDKVLDVLGFESLSESTLPNGGGYVDRVLFGSADERRAAKQREQDGDSEGLFNRSLALLEAKQWGHDFEQQFSEQRQYRNASHQIKHYLERTPDGVNWGILTDGKKWRLYGTKDYETQTYYEVDLEDLIRRNDVEAFKRFFVFFRAEAFRESKGTTFLDRVWSESETAAQELGEDLQDNVFTALRVLGEGFVERNDLTFAGNGDLSELKEQSLVLLYRLMFILYAESRGLIHPETPGARKEYEENFSLETLREDIKEEIDSGETFDSAYSEYSDTMWSRLTGLFDLIDTGEENLGIPPYNGGLFDSAKHAFLDEYDIADPALAEVIYLISTTESETSDEIVFADYADLDTRHLGGIYEGLLEHQFRIADEPLAAVAADGGQEWKPQDEVTVADSVEKVERGELYVVNDDGERKATGAYYTPDYVVTYIVEETVDPLLDEIREDLDASGVEQGTPQYYAEFKSRVLDLKVLDPAMGSGHFLTKATEYLADAVMAEARDLETGGMYDEQIVRREVSKECIYGVDLNEMAVELAKLSMWLETLAADQPLAFLDHHFKAGNSLVGSDIETIEGLESDASEDASSQSSLAEFGATRAGTIERLMDIYQEFLAMENTDYEDVKAMERKYHEIEEDELRQRLVAMANVRTAEDFGVDVPGGAYERMARALEDDDEWATVEETDWYQTGQVMAEEEEFFHWKLEFPEVFYEQSGDKAERSGFDAVVGNPPYVSSRNAEFSDEILSYFETEYDLALYQIDLYYLFIELSKHLCARKRQWSFIVPDTWLGSVKTSEVREWLVQNNQIVSIGLPESRVFEAQVDCIVPICNTSVENSVETSVWGISETHCEKLRSVTLPTDGDVFVLSGGASVIDKVEQNSISIGDISLTGRGIGAYHHSKHSEDTIENREFHSETKEDDTYRPELGGENVQRYGISWDGDRWISYGDWLSEPREPELFNGPRLLCRKILSDRLCCTYTDDEYLVDQQVYVAAQFEGPYNAKYVAGLLCSTLFGFYTRIRYNEDTELFPHLRVSQFRELPIRQVTKGNSDFQSNHDSAILDIADSVDLPFDIKSEDGLCTPECRDTVSLFVERVISLRDDKQALNLSLRDYLGNYSDGPTLADLSPTPPKGFADSILAETKETRDSLRVGSVNVSRENDSLTIELSARYKPESEDDYETDRWGYTETALEPAMVFHGMDEEQADLIESFVPVAVEEAGGFAGFRETATKTNSLVDRLEGLTLPALTDVRDGLARYRNAVARAEELDEKIERTDALIDEIVYELYGLTDEEIEIVEEAVGS